MTEQLYNDFTTKLLPKIQEGLVISKDYFLDLFGRYIKYLIIHDIIFASIGIITLILGIISLRKAIKWGETIDPESSGFVVVLGILSIVAIVAGITMMISNSLNLVKDIYIPEIRIYQQLQYINQ